MQFSQKVVLITGATGGIGKATAKAFAKEGAKLALVSRNIDKLQSLAEELEISSNDYLLIEADVSKEEDVQRYVEQTKEAFGSIDVFFNNAGILGKLGPIKDLSSSDFEQVLDVNVKSVFYGLKHVINVMAEQKSGVIINTSSIAGLVSNPGSAGYSASKHAVNALTKVAAWENAGNGIRVNAVCPSPTETNMGQELLMAIAPGNPTVAEEKLNQLNAFNRFAKPEEVANLVLFLASDKASYITAGIYPIDGGYTAK